MYFYIISCLANILSTVTFNVYPVNLIIFRGHFEECLALKKCFSRTFLMLVALALDVLHRSN